MSLEKAIADLAAELKGVKEALVENTKVEAEALAFAKQRAAEIAPTGKAWAELGQRMLAELDEASAEPDCEAEQAPVKQEPDPLAPELTPEVKTQPKTASEVEKQMAESKPEAKAEQAKPLNRDDIKKRNLAIYRSGKREQVKALFDVFGIENFKDLPDEKLAEWNAKLDEIEALS